MDVEPHIKQMVATAAAELSQEQLLDWIADLVARNVFFEGISYTVNIRYPEILAKHWCEPTSAKMAPLPVSVTDAPF